MFFFLQKMNENEVSDLVNEMFPANYEYKVLSCEKFEMGTDSVKFCIEMRVNVANKDEVKTFLQEFYQSSGCTFNMQTGRQDRCLETAAARAKLRGYRKCSMNVCEKKGKENKQPGKNTNCSACINFRLENSKARRNEESIRDKEDFPLWLKINFDHNHSLNRAEFLNFRSVSDVTKSEYTKLFESGLSPIYFFC